MRKFLRCLVPGLAAAALLGAGGYGVLEAQGPAPRFDCGCGGDPTPDSSGCNCPKPACRCAFGLRPATADAMFVRFQQPAPAEAKPKTDHGGLHVEGEYTLVVTKFPFQVIGPKGADLYQWGVPNNWEVSGDEDVLTVTKAPPGAGVVTLKTLTFDLTKKPPEKVKKNYKLSVTIGGVRPPDPPDPPDPPSPDTNPLPSKEGLRALIVEESSLRSSLPRPQFDVIMSEADGSVRQHLRQRCAPNSATQVPDWAVWDQNVDASQYPSDWLKKALARPRRGVPWLVASGPLGFWEGPLPADTAATLTILKKVGGA